MAFEDHYSFALHKVGLLISGLALLVPLSIYGQDVAFVNVNIVPMDRERVLGAQTVLISGGQIKAMGAVRKIALPKGTLRVDGTGKYLCRDWPICMVTCRIGGRR